MNLIALILQEFKVETDTTVCVFEEINNDILKFRPHEKSMNIIDLANHMLLIPSWVAAILRGSEFDWETYTPGAPVTSKEELIIQYAKNVAAAVNALETATDTILRESWTMKKGDFTYFTLEKHQAIRNLILNHTIHHRAQMGVNLRLSGIKVPASYVSSADENLFA